MKKIVMLLFAALLALSLVPAVAEKLYESDFSNGTDGWYPRSAGSATLKVLPEGAIRIEGRTDNWNSPGRDFDLVPDGKYRMSVMVRQGDVERAGFMISVAHSVDGAETYENLARATVNRDEWTELKCEYTAGPFERFVLYVETTDAPELSFDMRDFKLDAPYGKPVPKVTPEPMVIEPVDDMPSLKEIYAGKFDIGVCAPQFMFSDAQTMDFVKSQFSILTPENELKPDSVIDIPGSRVLSQDDETAVAVKFGAATPLLDYALKNGMKVHGHVLVWYQQTPEAFFREGYDPSKPLVSREVMLGRLENYIRAVMEYTGEHYPGVIVSWDVVNEAIDDSLGRRRECTWMDVVGEDFIERAFEYARKYAPEGTLLYYNDYNTASLSKQNGIVQLLEALMAEGNIDGYGFQMHHALRYPTFQQIKSSVERIAKLGLRLRVSEMDICVSNNSVDSFTQQGELYGRIRKVLIEHADQFEAVQFWGLRDDMSWRASQYPLLFDRHLNPKPAFWAVAEAE